MSVDTVLMNGSVGVGKTSVAEQLGALLEQRGVAGAIIDLDALRRAWPTPPDDPFHNALALRNLAAVAANARDAGALVVVVAAVAESHREVQQLADAVGAGRMLHVVLTADADAVAARLTVRHTDDDIALQWHMRRNPELARILDRAGFDDAARIDTTELLADAAARRILDAMDEGPAG